MDNDILIHTLSERIASGGMSIENVPESLRAKVVELLNANIQ